MPSGCFSPFAPSSITWSITRFMKGSYPRKMPWIVLPPFSRTAKSDKNHEDNQLVNRLSSNNYIPPSSTYTGPFYPYTWKKKKHYHHTEWFPVHTWSGSNIKGRTPVQKRSQITHLGFRLQYTYSNCFLGRQKELQWATTYFLSSGRLALFMVGQWRSSRMRYDTLKKSKMNRSELRSTEEWRKDGEKTNWIYWNQNSNSWLNFLIPESWITCKLQAAQEYEYSTKAPAT